MTYFIVFICVLIIVAGYFLAKKYLIDGKNTENKASDSVNDRSSFREYQKKQTITSDNVIPLLSEYLHSININHSIKNETVFITYQGENIPFVTLSCSLKKNEVSGFIYVLYPWVCHFEDIAKGKEVCRRINEENDLVFQFAADEDGDIMIDAMLNIQQIESIEKLESAIGYVFALADHYYPEFIGGGGTVTMQMQISHTLEPKANH